MPFTAASSFHENENPYYAPENISNSSESHVDVKDLGILRSFLGVFLCKTQKVYGCLNVIKFSQF